MWASTPTKMLQVVWCKSGRQGYKRCGKTGRRGNRRSAASGGRSELISRKCPDWRPQQWPGIGWHDGGQPPAPTEGVPGVRSRKKSPVTALPCQPPLGKGAEGTGVTDCHTSDIGHWFAMTGGFTWGAVQDRRATARVAPTKALQGVRWGGQGQRPLRWVGRYDGPSFLG